MALYSRQRLGRIAAVVFGSIVFGCLPLPTKAAHDPLCPNTYAASDAAEAAVETFQTEGESANYRALAFTWVSLSTSYVECATNLTKAGRVNRAGDALYSAGVNSFSAAQAFHSLGDSFHSSADQSAALDNIELALENLDHSLDDTPPGSLRDFVKRFRDRVSRTREDWLR